MIFPNYIYQAKCRCVVDRIDDLLEALRESRQRIKEIGG